MKRTSVMFIAVLAFAGGLLLARYPTQAMAAAQAGAGQARPSTPAPTGSPAPYAGSPYLGELRNKVLYGEIWERPQISKRARSMVTIAVLQAQGRNDELRGHIERGLTNGLTAEEISEIILHTTFYAGWPTGASASRIAAEVFEKNHLTLKKAAEYHAAPKPEKRAYTTGAYAAVPRLGELRDALLYGDVWERPQLSKHDRSLITCVVAQALGATSELRGHIRRALDQNKVTPQELSEAILQTAFYAGWPAAVNAGGLAAEAYKERGVDLDKLQ
jgi:4-carboxymuconolactone decarboxylase